MLLLTDQRPAHMRELDNKMALIKATGEALERAVAEFDICPTYERAQYVQKLDSQLKELRATLPKLRAVE
jgi:ribosomal protein S12 methylthiotransferase accessory factor YcaO